MVGLPKGCEYVRRLGPRSLVGLGIAWAGGRATRPGLGLRTRRRAVAMAAEWLERLWLTLKLLLVTDRQQVGRLKIRDRQMRAAAAPPLHKPSRATWWIMPRALSRSPPPMPKEHTPLPRARGLYTCMDGSTPAPGPLVGDPCSLVFCHHFFLASNRQPRLSDMQVSACRRACLKVAFGWILGIEADACLAGHWLLKPAIGRVAAGGQGMVRARKEEVMAAAVVMTGR
ncbi:hypothetical protein IWX90DRAFT_137823 [Phyllosticta citrichinensis]|uniref:Uncharacterized protein n=1 Tax=Phyllosticta citrichinensis TaxID=1130410 RepID=A0ABR1XY85_9PEZI